MKLLSIVFAAAVLGACGDKEDKEAGCEIGQACYARDTALNVSNISGTDSARSHNQGLNCMSCHQAHGPGKGLFKVAGTVTNADGSAAQGAKLILYKDKDHTQEVLTVDVDKFGNFYSTEDANFPADTFPVLKSADGTKSIAMPYSTASGACNMCHVGRQVLQFD